MRSQIESRIATPVAFVPENPTADSVATTWGDGCAAGSAFADVVGGAGGAGDVVVVDHSLLAVLDVDAVLPDVPHGQVGSAETVRAFPVERVLKEVVRGHVEERDAVGMHDDPVLRLSPPSRTTSPRSTPLIVMSCFSGGTTFPPGYAPAARTIVSPGCARPIASCNVATSCGTRISEADATGLARFAAGTSANATPASAATRITRRARPLTCSRGRLGQSPARMSILFSAGEARYQPPCALSPSQNHCPGFMPQRSLERSLFQDSRTLSGRRVSADPSMERRGGRVAEAHLHPQSRALQRKERRLPTT